MAEVRETGGSTNQAKRRRIPKSCAACRYSKLRCDRKVPCTRCSHAGIDCSYFERPQDPSKSPLGTRNSDDSSKKALTQARRLILLCTEDAERIHQLEREIAHLRQQLDAVQGLTPQTSTHSMSSPETNVDHYHPTQSGRDVSEIPNALCNFAVRQHDTVDLVSAGVVQDSDARAWFSAFFEGCDRFVPVFDSNDTYDAVRARSSTLFDIIVVYGARAACGSDRYQSLYSILRQRTSDLVLRLSGSNSQDVSLEDFQAILIIASYSTSGAILSDIAIRAAIRAGLPSKLDALLGSVADLNSSDMQQLVSDMKDARIWSYLFVLDVILSLDGGKPSSLILQSPRRMKTLLNHSQGTILDVRLFAQVELNALRSSSHTSLLGAATASNAEDAVKGIVRGTVLDLNVWLSEWQGLAYSGASVDGEHETLHLNLQVQHAWALLTLHLRALTTLGIENIALMTQTQRNLAKAAKEEAEHHLQLILTSSGDERDIDSAKVPKRPYIENFPYAMEFVWAKNAFCVLVALRLGILLADPVDNIRARLAEANDFLRELDRVGVGANISYTRILRQTVQKCESAIQASLEPSSLQDPPTASESDFESFAPKQFVFEWDFPGLNLCHIPLDWRDLFLDIETAA